MDYLAREDAPFSSELWEKIDATVVETARRSLTGRRFLSIFGPLGAGALSINIDERCKQEVMEDGFVKTAGRRFLEIPQLYEDFTLLWRDLENSEKFGYPVDLSAAVAAAQAIARREDGLIFFGNDALGYEGLFNVAGRQTLPMNEWGEGENAFTDIAAAVSTLAKNGYVGRYALAISPDVFLKMQRIQQGTGMLEIDRVKKLIEDRVYMSSALGLGKAILVCAEPQYMDLAVGQDLATGYLELKDFNHSFRILETILLRIKCPQAIVTFE